MKKFKRICLVFLVALISLSGINPVSAQEVNKENQNNNNDNEYTYFFNGIEIKGNTSLTEEELEQMYNNAVNIKTMSKESTLSPETGLFAEDPGSSQVVVIPPYYRSYTNADKKAVADIITIYIISRTPKKIKETAFGTWVLGKLSGWTNNIGPTYVGSWATSSWSNYQNKRVYHATLVHYHDSGYKRPKTIQYWDISHQYY